MLAVHKNRLDKDSRAFTLIELIIVIVVLGILSTIAIVGYQTVINKSTEAKQVSRMTQVLKEAKVLYVQNIYSDSTYTWAQAVASAVGDLPTYTVGALSNWSEGAQASGGTNSNTNTNGWTVETDSTTTDVIYSAGPNEIIIKEVAGVMYLASSTSNSSTKGVFGMVSQTIAPFVWLAGCLGSTCDAATASSGPPAGSSYASGTTAVTTTGPTTTVAVTTTAAPTTTIALTCATGGVCVVGNTGPGGGIVFYVEASAGTFSCGTTLTATCRYLEAAPTSGTLAWTDAAYGWSGNTNTYIGAAAQGGPVGRGLKNTEAIIAQSNTAGMASTIARAYRGPNNLTDWNLPSNGELWEMWLRRTVLGGFPSGTYWSSTEGASADYVWAQSFSSGNQILGPLKSYTTLYVRPVRAF